MLLILKENMHFKLDILESLYFLPTANLSCLVNLQVSPLSEEENL